MRIGFLFNHYEPHQIPHAAPYAFALSRLRPDWSVDILCSSAAEEAFVKDIAPRFPGERATRRRLQVPLHARMLDPVISNFAFYRKRAVQRANQADLARYDALITPEITSLALKSAPGFERVKFIFTCHGSGDLFSNHFGPFDVRIKNFDFMILPKRRMAHTLERIGRADDILYGVSGYPKFECFDGTRKRLFDNDLPTVLYNPTQNPHGTSWHAFGPAVLDYFYARQDLNLIFAPHALLFKRGWTRGARLPTRFRATDRVRIDLGSRASFDMTYLASADLYLGDQSSQIYEFIPEPRPCVFLNQKEVGWRDNIDFLSWSFGPVVERIEDLGPAIDAAFAEFDRWRPAQEKALSDDAIDAGAPYADRPASERGAHMIAEFLEHGELSPAWR